MDTDEQYLAPKPYKGWPAAGVSCLLGFSPVLTPRIRIEMQAETVPPSNVESQWFLTVLAILPNIVSG